jgi:hypothetical protein
MTFELLVYTVYCKPSDFPGSYVVRRSRPLGGKVEHEREVWCLANTLEGARASIPQELYRQDRHPSDDPVIVETWF